MSTDDDGITLPLVADTTKSQSESIETIIGRLQKDRVYIPDYQRDAEQWDERKESLFVESLLNNLTIPAFFFAEDESGNYEVVDGQQRLMTIRKFFENKLQLSSEEDVVYLSPQCRYYASKTYEELPEKLRNLFNDYPLTIIYLPRTIKSDMKLEIFRRINEGGTPLTGQDIRLSYYSSSKAVTYIRLAGLHREGMSTDRMIAFAKTEQIEVPWDFSSDSWNQWKSWWEGKEKAKGQTPSEMFLWFLVTLDRDGLNNLLAAKDGTKHLNIAFRGGIDTAMDVYCAQLLFQERHKPGKLALSGIDVIQKKHFPAFKKWMDKVLGFAMPGITVDRYKQLALFIAAATEIKLDPDKLSEKQWELIGEFVRSPRKACEELLGKGAFPEPKGRWVGPKGQKVQCDKAVEAVQVIAKK